MTNQVTSTQHKSFETSEGLEFRKKMWENNRPQDMQVIEFCGFGDPFFGGDADDRVLGTDGIFHPSHKLKSPAVFKTIEEAHQAAKSASIERRKDSIIGVLPRW